MRSYCDDCGKPLSPMGFYVGSYYHFKNGCCDAQLGRHYDNDDTSRVLRIRGKKRLETLEGLYPINYVDDVKYALTSTHADTWMGYFLLYGRSPYENTNVYRAADNSIGMTFTDKSGRLKKIEGRPVRILKKLLTKKDLAFLADHDYEAFHNMFEGALRNSTFKWRFVQGEKIRDWYYEKSYAPRCGMLNDSCMAGKECQPYLDIYVKNTKVCKLLTVRSENDDLLHGRALVWKLANGQTYMDRIYANDLLRPQIKAYAQSRGWLTEERSVFSHVKLDEGEFSLYPYLDTFKYLNTKEKTLHTERHVDGLTENDRKDYICLDETDGSSYPLTEDYSHIYEGELDVAYSY